MGLDTESVNEKNIKEFKALLEESFKKNSLKEGNIIKAKVSEVGKKFILCEIPGSKFEGVIPIEEFKIAKELDSLKIGSTINVYLERIESYKGEIVVSREKARRMNSWKEMEKAFKTQEEVEGIITSRCKGGYIVNINSCLCFLPGSQIDTKPLKNFDHLMNVPQKFLCVKLDENRGNIVVSRRAILEKSKNQDLDKVLAKIKEGDIIEGQVKAITDWGAFLDINGADALLHITDMSYSRVRKTSDLLSVGQTIKVKITKIDKETKRISCGIKQMHPDPYDSLEKKFKLNETYKGTVTKVLDYGAFIKLEDGLEGLCHQTELDWTKKNVQPNKVLSISQEINVKIIEIDSEKRRISLSYKQTLGNPWDDFLKKTSTGSVVNAKVKNITDFALFVSIGDSSLTGMIHFKDIDWKESEESLKKFKKGDSVKAKVLEIDREKEKIRLSIRELESDPFDYFKNMKTGNIITVTVKEVLPKKGVKVIVGNNENLLVTIKKSQLALNPEDQRETIFQPGNRLDCAILELDSERRKVTLSVKEKERLENEEAIKKFGKEGKSSGQSLKSIFGKALGRKKSKDNKKK